MCLLQVCAVAGRLKEVEQQLDVACQTMTLGCTSPSSSPSDASRCALCQAFGVWQDTQLCSVQKKTGNATRAVTPHRREYILAFVGRPGKATGVLENWNCQPFQPTACALGMGEKPLIIGHFKKVE